MERIVLSFFSRFYTIQSTISISIDLEKSSLSRPADNYVPRGETRWIGEIDRRDLLPIRGGRAGGTNVSSGKGRRIRGGACAVKHERSDLSIAIEATTSLAHGGPSVEKHR